MSKLHLKSGEIKFISDDLMFDYLVKNKDLILNRESVRKRPIIIEK